MKKTLLVLIMLCFAMGNLFAMSGSGTVGDPYIITTPSDLALVMDDANFATYWASGVYIELGANVDMNGQSGIDPIGNNSNTFSGQFNGKGYVISNLNINAPSLSYQALFGYIETGATVSNLGVEDATVFGNIYVGGFVGWNKGTITNCYATGDATGQSEDVGGFCGRNEGIIENCYATGNTDGDSDVGCFLGDNYYGTIENCYATGDATGQSQVGGFVGHNDNGTYTCCFWNETANSGLDDSGNDGDLGNEVTGLSETQFADPSSFSCFDFNNDWAMGYNVVDSEYLYPMLRAFDYVVIPTLTEWAVIIFIGLLAGVGGWFVWRRM